MKKTLFALFLAAVFAGCTTPQPKVPPVALGPYSTTAKKEILLTDRDRGAFVTLKPNQTVSVSLPTNTKAGYRWSVAKPLDPKHPVVQAAEQPLPPIALPPESFPNYKIETQTWVFKPVGVGPEKVRLIYSRPDQSINDAVTYEFTVNAE